MPVLGGRLVWKTLWRLYKTKIDIIVEWSISFSFFFQNEELVRHENIFTLKCPSDHSAPRANEKNKVQALNNKIHFYTDILST